MRAVHHPLPGRLRTGRRRRRRPRLDWPGLATGRRSRPRRHPLPRATLRRGLALAAVAASLVVGPARPVDAHGHRRIDRASPAEPAAPADPAPPTDPVVTYAPPVDAPIVDPFRPPAGPYASGNRGLEYDTSPGEVVRASARGTVAFAGPVAGSLHVTVVHPDGVRTSYSFLQAVSTVVGATVAGGDPLGTAGEGLHFGARVGDAYFDPAALFAGAPAVELLPFEVPPGSTPDAEARALLELAGLGGGGPPLGALAPTLRWLRDRPGEGVAALAVGPGLTGAGTLGRGLSLASDLVDRLAFAEPCSSGPPPSRPAGARRRVAVTVAGLGSTSASAAIDDLRTTELGYDEALVLRFSYAGGRTPGTGVDLVGVPASPYTSAHTQGDAVAAAGRLADLLEQVAETVPGAVVDVYAHSLGGLVTRLALVELERRGFDLGRLGLVVTLASPHRGADLASAVSAAADAPRAGPALDAAAALLDLELDPDAPVVEQLSERSPLVHELATAGVPEGVALLSIAARGDLVVASPHTRIGGGASEVTVPVAGVGAHSDVVGSDAATAEVARALAGQPPGCEAWHDVVADVVTGHAISAVEDDIGLVLGAAG